MYPPEKFVYDMKYSREYPNSASNVLHISNVLLVNACELEGIVSLWE